MRTEIQEALTTYDVEHTNSRVFLHQNGAITSIFHGIVAERGVFGLSCIRFSRLLS
jgi:hypothetical protein